MFNQRNILRILETEILDKASRKKDIFSKVFLEETDTKLHLRALMERFRMRPFEFLVATTAAYASFKFLLWGYYFFIIQTEEARIKTVLKVLKCF